MAVDDPMHGGQANTRTPKIRFRVQPLEWPEQLVGISHIETRAVVTDEIRNVSFSHRGSKLDAGGRSLGREFPRVPKEIVEYNPHQPIVGSRIDSFLNLHVDLALRLPFLLFCDRNKGEAR